jgi:DNA-binding IclR family transcriptional regulator
MSNVPEKGGAEAFCTMAEVAAQLGIAASSVNRAMQALQKRHILMKRKQGKWHVNTWLMYNGDFDSWNVDAEHDPEPIWVRGVDMATGEVK